MMSLDPGVTTIRDATFAESQGRASLFMGKDRGAIGNNHGALLCAHKFPGLLGAVGDERYHVSPFSSTNANLGRVTIDELLNTKVVEEKSKVQEEPGAVDAVPVVLEQWEDMEAVMKGWRDFHGDSLSDISYIMDTNSEHKQRTDVP